MMHIVDMTHVWFDEEDEPDPDADYHFAVYNTVTDKFLTEPVFKDQVWTKEEWETAPFHPAIIHRIRTLLPGYEPEDADTPRCRDCGLPKTPIDGGLKGWKCIDCYWE